MRSGDIVLPTARFRLIRNMNVVGNGDFAAEAHQVFKNLRAVAQTAGGSLDDIVKLNAYLTDLGNFAVFNEVMAEYFTQPIPPAPPSAWLPCPKACKWRPMPCWCLICNISRLSFFRRPQPRPSEHI